MDLDNASTRRRRARGVLLDVMRSTRCEWLRRLCLMKLGESERPRADRTDPRSVW